MELAIPERAAIGFAGGSRQRFKPLIAIIYQVQAGAILSRFQSAGRFLDTVFQAFDIVRMDEIEQRLGAVFQCLGIDTEELLGVIADVGKRVGLAIGAKRIGEKYARHR